MRNPGCPFGSSAKKQRTQVRLLMEEAVQLKKFLTKLEKSKLMMVTWVTFVMIVPLKMMKS